MSNFNRITVRRTFKARRLLQTFLAIFVISTLFVAFTDDLASQREAAAAEVLAESTRVESVAGYETDVTAEDIVALTNVERRLVGSRTLSTNSILTGIAQRKAELYAKENYFDHTEPDGKEYYMRFKEAGYYFSYAGENLIVDALSTATSQKLIELWVASDGHYRNMIKPQYREIGVGVAIGIRAGVPAVWVVQEFGTQQ